VPAHQLERTQRLTGLIPCQNCSLANCAYRRAPYRRTNTALVEVEAASAGERSTPFGVDARYSVNTRALQRWAAERLTLTPQDDGTIDAIFRYDGTTCSNMGRPLAYHYFIKLGPRGEGYPLREMSCAPAPGDEGHKYMCRYISMQRDVLIRAIENEKPLLGQPLGDVLTWTRSSSPAGCYCDASSREHKWGLALETLHFALAKRKEGT